MAGDKSVDPVLRPARRADLPTLGRLGALLVQEHHEFDKRRFLAATKSTADHYGSFLGSQLDDPNVIVLVAESAGDVIGYAFAAIEGYDYLTLRGPAGLLHDLIVDPGHRGGRNGRPLLHSTFFSFA